MIIKIKDKEINQFYEIDDLELPKYVSQILNLAWCPINNFTYF